MTELNSKSFVETICSNTLSIVDFWAEWCMPCKIFTPVLEELSEELKGKANFYKVNVDECNDLAQKYMVASIPTVIVFKNGEELSRIVGVQPKEKILALVEQNL